MNQLNDNSLINLTETIIRQLNDLDFKVNQINELKTLINNGRNEFLTRKDDMTQNEKEVFLCKMEDDIKSMESLVTTQYSKYL